MFGGKFEDLWNALEKKLTRLHTLIKNQEKEKLIVYIFAGIGGGTGSGTIIDIPYIVREIVKRKEWSTDVYGYIFLPDTYSTKVEHMSINSYAALQEIDALMSLGDTKEVLKRRMEHQHIQLRVINQYSILVCCFWKTWSWGGNRTR